MLNTKNYNLAEYWEEDDFQKYQPTRVRMRDYYGKGNNTVREKYYSHDTGFWRELERFLEARVGRDFDYVFSEFCVKFPKYAGRVNTRVEFMEQIRNHYSITEDNKLGPRIKHWWEK